MNEHAQLRGAVVRFQAPANPGDNVPILLDDDLGHVSCFMGPVGARQSLELPHQRRRRLAFQLMERPGILWHPVPAVGVQVRVTIAARSRTNKYVFTRQGHEIERRENVTLLRSAACEEARHSLDLQVCGHGLEEGAEEPVRLTPNREPRPIPTNHVLTRLRNQQTYLLACTRDPRSSRKSHGNRCMCQGPNDEVARIRNGTGYNLCGFVAGQSKHERGVGGTNLTDVHRSPFIRLWLAQQTARQFDPLYGCVADNLHQNPENRFARPP